MKQVTREEFYNLLRATSRPRYMVKTGSSTEFWFTDDKSLFGEIIDLLKDGEEVSEYYVNE